MEKIIHEYITRTEVLLSIHPQSELIKSYLLQLKSLKEVPEVHLTGFNDAIPLVYKTLTEVENLAQNEVVLRLFSAMVENTKLAVEPKKYMSELYKSDKSLL